MRRYIFSGATSGLPTVSCDVLIVGGGLAGLYAGLHISPEKKAMIIAKEKSDMSNSWLAQGGIASVISPDDCFESHIEDTLKAGAGICDISAVTLLVKEGPENIRELIDYKVPFDLDGEGELMITREGGHSCRRIVHCGGDATGREVTKRLGELVLERENLEVKFGAYLIDILTEDNGVVGAIVYDGRPMIVECENIILATGGIGAIYDHTTNPAGAIGDGIAAAERAGAEIYGMEFVQFHPTTMMPQVGQEERRFLISEAVRGEGGILKNHKNEAFMEGKHPLRDLAPRDIVTREIIKEMRRTGKDNVFLDVSSMSEEFFSKRFPTIYGECKRCGINVPTDMIPVRPSQHYLMGGIKTNLDAMTNIDGLYACGECAWTGIHGGNRLASNSMLECLVFGRLAARHINGRKSRLKRAPTLSETPISGGRTVDFDIEEKKAELRAIMTDKANAVRTSADMAECKEFCQGLLAKLEGVTLREIKEYQLYSMAQVANMIISSAILRKESVGAHYLED